MFFCKIFIILSDGGFLFLIDDRKAHNFFPTQNYNPNLGNHYLLVPHITIHLDWNIFIVLAMQITQAYHGLNSWFFSSISYKLYYTSRVLHFLSAQDSSLKWGGESTWKEAANYRRASFSAITRKILIQLIGFGSTWLMRGRNNFSRSILKGWSWL